MNEIRTAPNKWSLFSKLRRKKQQPEQNPAFSDPLITAKTSVFEKGIIIQCREEGMSDDEIRSWLDIL